MGEEPINDSPLQSSKSSHGVWLARKMMNLCIDLIAIRFLKLVGSAGGFEPGICRRGAWRLTRRTKIQLPKVFGSEKEKPPWAHKKNLFNAGWPFFNGR